MSLKINSFLKEIFIKKKIGEGNSNKKKTLLFNEKVTLKGYFIKFIIYISCTKSNTFIHIMDCLGSERYFYSINSISKSTKSKKNSDIQVTEKFYKILVAKLKFLQGTSVALHFNSIEFNFQWFLEKIAKKLFITIVRFYTKYSHNGCRKKKIKRKKIKRIVI
jgi:ribosomal protein S11